MRDYDILRTNSDGTSNCWVEAAQDLETAQNRIDDLSSIQPGEYLVFSQKLQRIVLITTAAGDVLVGPRPVIE